MRYTRTAITQLTKMYRSVLKKCAFLNALILTGVVAASPSWADYINTETTAFQFGDVSIAGQEYMDNTAFGGRRGAWTDGKYLNTFPQYQLEGRSFGLSGSKAYVGPVELTLRKLTDADHLIYNYQLNGDDVDLANLAHVDFGNTQSEIVAGVAGVIGADNAQYTAPGVVAFANRDDSKAAGSMTITNSNMVIDGATVNANTINVSSSNLTFAKKGADLLTAGLSPEVRFYTNAASIDSDGKSALNADTMTFDGSRVVVNAGAELTINPTTSATISNATTEGNGGAVYNQGTMNIGSSTFDGNTTASRGGAIFNYGTTSIDGATFTGNRTTSTSYPSQGGAIYNAGDVEYLDKYGILTISNSTFGDANDNTKGNIAMQGGAISNDSGNGYNAELTLNNTNFYYNKAQSSADGGYSALGGAIHSTLNDADVIVNGDTTFKGNSAIGYSAEGGAIYNSSWGKFTFNDTVTFDSNIAEDTNGANGGQGGAISNADGTMVFKDLATFTNNKAIGDGQTSGGALYNANETTFENGASFSKNEATFGGAIFNADGTVNLTDASFTNNHAGDEGGAIFNLEGTTNINAVNSNVAFSGNKGAYGTEGEYANDITNYAGTINLNATTGKTISLAGGIDGVSGTVNITGAGTVEASTIKNQTVAVNGGELHLTPTATGGSNIAGSAITVASGAIANTIDGVINDYATGGEGKGTITLADGAIIKGDIDYVNGVADTYAAEADAVVTYKMANALGADIQYGATKEIQVVSDGATVNKDVSFAWYTTDHGLTLVGSDAADGKIKVTGTAGGINGAVDNTTDTGTPSVVDYSVTGNETFNGAGGTDNVIANSDFTITGQGTESTAPAITLATDMVVGDATKPSTLTLNAVKLAGTKQLQNTAGSTVTIKDSAIGVSIVNSGTLVSDPTTYTAHQINEGTASYTDDTFALASAYTGAADTTAQGGALYNTGTLTLTNTDFTNNTLQSATSTEGATKNSAATGGAIWTNKAINVTGGTFSGNEAYSRSWNGTASGSTAGVGGAIAFSGGTDVTTDSTLNGVTFTNNKVTYDYVSSGSSTKSSTGYGGAIYYNQNANLNILGNSSFTGNEAAYGGAIYGKAGSVIIGGDGNNVTVSNNTSATQGGGIYNNANLSVTDAIISSNTSGTGGGIYTKGGSITGTDIYSNSATNTTKGNGGGIYNTTGNLTVTDSTIGGSGIGNTATVSGGGIYIMSGALTVDNSSIAYNTAKLGSTTDVTNAGGGGIYKYGAGALTIQNGSHIDNNTATKSLGGGIYNNGSGAITIDDSTVSGNTANFGGGIYKGSTGTLTITDSEVSSNTANNIGGGIYNAGAGDISLTDVTMSGNTAGIAGAIASMSTGKLDITHSTFNANTATDTDNGRGGAIYAENAGDVTILGSAFGDGTAANANTAATNGGAINVSNTKLTIDKDTSDNNTTFNYNTAQSGGAIFAASSAELDIANTDFSNNKATGTVGDSGDGGAIYITNSVTGADIDNSTFTSNSAVRGAGAVWAGVDTNITNSTFTSNETTGTGTTDDYGAGALFVGGSSNTTVINSKFVTNESAGNGGAIATRDSSTTSSLSITGNGTAATEFNGNTAAKGGAIYTGVDTVIANTNFTDNTATTAGGAIYGNANSVIGIIADGSDVTFSGNTVNDGVNPAVANDIHNLGQLELIATGSNSITLGDGITGDGDININSLSAVDSYKYLNGTSIDTKDLTGGDSTVTTTSGTVIFNEDVSAGNLNVAAGTLTNNADLTVESGTNNGTISGANGTFELDGTSFANNGSFTQKSLTITNGTFTTDAANLHLTDDIDNDGTLSLTGGTLASAVSGDGSTVIDGTVSSTAAISNTAGITVKAATTADPSVASQLTIGASNVGAAVDNDGKLILQAGELAKAVSGDGATEIAGAVTVDDTNGSIAQDIDITAGSLTANANKLTGDDINIKNGAELALTGGTLAADINGYTVDPLDPTTTTYGALSVTGNTTLNGITTVKALTVADDITLDAGDDVTVNTTLANTGEITGDGDLTLLGGTALAPVTNEGAITTASVVVGDDTHAAVFKNAGTIGSNTVNTAVNVANGTLTNDANKTITGDVTNSGTVTNNGDISGNVTNSGTATNAGTITGDVANNAGGTLTNTAGHTITGNVTNAATGTVANAGTVAGNVTNSGTATNTGLINGNITNNAGTFTTAGVDNTTTPTSGVTGTITNNAALNVTGGTVVGAVSGTGTTEISGDTTLAAAVEQAIGVDNGVTLTANANNIQGAVTNTGTGTLELTGGDLNQDVTGGNLDITGDVAVGTMAVVESDSATTITAGNTLTTGDNAVTLGDTTIDGTLTAGSGDVTLGDTTVNGTLDVGTNNKVTLGDTTMGANGELDIDVTSLTSDSYTGGHLKVDSLNNTAGGNLNLDIANGYMEEQHSQANVKLITKNGTDEAVNAFTADQITVSGDYNVQVNPDGSIVIVNKNSYADVSSAAIGNANNVSAATGWDNATNLPDGSLARDIQKTLNKISKNNPGAYVNALTNLAPTDSALYQSVALEVSNLINEQVTDRLKSQGMNSGDVFERQGAWVKTFYSHAEQDSDRSTPGFTGKTKGIAFGLDGQVDENTTVGVGYSYNTTDADSLNRDIDITGHNIFAYGKYQPSSWFVRGMVNYGLSDYEEKSHVLGFVKTADYDVKNYGFRTYVGYDLPNGFTPEAGLRYTHLTVENYMDSLGQVVRTDDIDILTATLGVNFQKDVETFGYKWTPKAHFGVTYDLANDGADASVVLGNSAYNISGEALDRFGIEAGVGAEMNMGDWSLSAEYEYGYRDNFENHTGMLQLKYNF